MGKKRGVLERDLDIWGVLTSQQKFNCPEGNVEMCREYLHPSPKRHEICKELEEVG
jgi:hypothetical protein